MREIWRGGLALARNHFGCCVALAGADNFAQKIENHTIYCEALTWRGFDFELFNGYFRAVFSQNCLFFKANSVLNFSFMRPALQKKYAQFNTTLHVKFGKFLQISSAKFAIYLAIFKFIFARKMEFKIALDLINFALLNLNHKKCALKPDFVPLRTKLCLNLRRNFATILHLKLIANLQLLRQISHSIFAINSHLNLRQSKNLVLNSPTNLNLHKNCHLNLQPNLSIISCFLRPNSHIYLNLRRNLLINSHLSRKDYFNYWHLRTILSKNSHRNLFAILFLLRQKLSLNLLLNRHSCAILHLINLHLLAINLSRLILLLNLCAILRTNLLLNLLEILHKNLCCDLHLSSSKKSCANSRWVERISCEKVA
jgi:hypothetical protein